MTVQGNASLFDLTGENAVVTGGSRGIGLGIATALGRAGAHVVLTGRDPDSLRAATEGLADEGIRAEGLAFDAADSEAMRVAIEDLGERFGRLDIVVGNAGTTIRKPLADLGPDDWRAQGSLLIDSCYHLVRAALPFMPTGSRIIFTASMMGGIARPNISAYVTFKEAVRGFARALAVELGPRGITANAIAPGFIETDLAKPLKADPKFDGWVCERTPLGRWGTVDEIAGAALFLASPAGGYVSGHTLVVDGGMTVNA